jgi:putative transcriptional regulator
MGAKNRLREIRHQMMIDKKREFAAMLGLDERQYGRYEGQETQPSMEVGLRIAKILGKRLDDIFYLEQD